MMRENDSLTKDCEYFKEIAKNAKGQAQKAIDDIDFYKGKLEEMGYFKLTTGGPISKPPQ